MAENIVIDLSNYKDRMGSKVEPGQYTVVVDDAEMDKSKAGNPMINVWFRIREGQHKDMTITDRFPLTEKAMFRIVGFMQALGLPTPKKRLQLTLDKFVGKSLLINVEDGEPYNGRVRSEVRSYERLMRKQAEPVAEMDEEEFDEDTEVEQAEVGNQTEVEPEEAEQVSDDPTDYDEDEEPQKVRQAKKNKAKSKPAPEPEESDEDDEDVDLNDIDEM